MHNQSMCISHRAHFTILSAVIVFKHIEAETKCDRDFADDIFKCIFLNENVWISMRISLLFLFPKLKVQIDNKPALVQLLAD